MTKMPRSLSTSSASGVVGPLAPSATIFDRRGDPVDVVAGDLVFERRRDQDLHLLLEPGVGLEDLVTRRLGLLLVDGAEAIGDRQQELDIDAVGFAEGVGAVIVVVPAGDRDHHAAELDQESWRRTARRCRNPASRRARP